MATSKRKLLWITDPWNTLDHAKDTTLRFIEESVLLRVPTFWADVKSIRHEKGEAFIDAFQAKRVDPPRTSQSFHWTPRLRARITEFDVICYRVDPPVDLAYTQPLQLLSQQFSLTAANRRKPEFVSPLSVLLGASEKLEATLLPSLSPPTWVGTTLPGMETFLGREKKAVLKPLHQAQSKGVELISSTSAAELARAKRLFSEASQEGRLPVLLQRYLPAIREEGETRLWFLDGKLLAHAKKLPKSGTFRIDMDRGGTLAAAPLNARDQAASVQIGKHLHKRGIRLAAVDLIEGLITDFNFTSPGLLTPMETLLKRNLAREVVQSLAKA